MPKHQRHRSVGNRPQVCAVVRVTEAGINFFCLGYFLLRDRQQVGKSNFDTGIGTSSSRVICYEFLTLVLNCKFQRVSCLALYCTLAPQLMKLIMCFVLPSLRQILVAELYCKNYERKQQHKSVLLTGMKGRWWICTAVPRGTCRKTVGLLLCLYFVVYECVDCSDVWSRSCRFYWGVYFVVCNFYTELLQVWPALQPVPNS
jgi:hypothetical protein